MPLVFRGKRSSAKKYHRPLRDSWFRARSVSQRRRSWGIEHKEVKDGRAVIRRLSRVSHWGQIVPEETDGKFVVNAAGPLRRGSGRPYGG